MAEENLKRTPLYAEHEKAGAKLIPFAGYIMPVQYPTGIVAEHTAVRTSCGLFDVSHMGEFDVRGPGALDLIQYVTTNDASTIEVGQAQYSTLPREDGTLLDDLIVYRTTQDRWLIVCNASNHASPPLIVTVTPLTGATGFLPVRDILFQSLSNRLTRILKQKP